MIDIDRLNQLRDHYANLRADYTHRSEAVRMEAAQLARDRNALMAAHPKISAQLEAMDDAALESKGVNVMQVAKLRSRSQALINKRTQLDLLGARVRAWSAYMQGVEALAKEYAA